MTTFLDDALNARTRELMGMMTDKPTLAERIEILRQYSGSVATHVPDLHEAFSIIDEQAARIAELEASRRVWRRANE